MPDNYLTEEEEVQAAGILQWLEETATYKDVMEAHIENARSGQNPLIPLLFVPRSLS